MLGEFCSEFQHRALQPTNAEVGGGHHRDVEVLVEQLDHAWLQSRGGHYATEQALGDGGRPVQVGDIEGEVVVGEGQGAVSFIRLAVGKQACGQARDEAPWAEEFLADVRVQQQHRKAARAVQQTSVGGLGGRLGLGQRFGELVEQPLLQPCLVDLLIESADIFTQLREVLALDTREKFVHDRDEAGPRLGEIDDTALFR